MSVITLIINILTFLLVGLAILWKSYFNEKGKNLATLEDIGKITKEIEEVKKDFTNESMKLSSKLDLIKNLQLNQKNDERLALINFHKNLKYWIILLTQSTPKLIDDRDNEEIQTKIFIYHQTYNEVLIAEAQLDLYTKDEKLMTLISDLKIRTLENLSQPPITYLQKLKFNNVELERIRKIDDYQKRSDEHKECLDERMKIGDEYCNDMIEGLKRVIDLEKQYKAYIQKSLQEISIKN